jgi:hypothetical protein
MGGCIRVATMVGREDLDLGVWEELLFKGC